MEALDVIDNNVPMIADDSLMAIAEQAEKRINAVIKIKQVVLKITNNRDWVDQQGKPYLQVSGAEKVARVFGISWRIDEPVCENMEGGHFSYTYKGYFTLGGVTIEAIGSRSSKDGFFKKYDYSKKDENGASLKTELPASEIDKGDVKKSAYTNCIGNGITRLLGIRNLTWEELETAKITRDGASRVDYKKSGKQQEGIKSEGAMTVNFIPSDVRKQTGKNKEGKPWTKYVVKGPDGEYNTFSETFAKKAVQAKDTGELICVIYKEGKFGNEIENVTDAVYDDVPPPEGE